MFSVFPIYHTVVELESDPVNIFFKKEFHIFREIRRSVYFKYPEYPVLQVIINILAFTLVLFILIVLIILLKCSLLNFHHLFIGTNQDNVNDKVAKGRQAKGEKQTC